MDGVPETPSIPFPVRSRPLRPPSVWFLRSPSLTPPTEGSTGEGKEMGLTPTLGEEGDIGKDGVKRRTTCTCINRGQTATRRQHQTDGVFSDIKFSFIMCHNFATVHQTSSKEPPSPYTLRRPSTDLWTHTTTGPAPQGLGDHCSSFLRTLSDTMSLMDVLTRDSDTPSSVPIPRKDGKTRDCKS